MRTYLECIPCIEKRLKSLSKRLTDDPKLRKAIVEGGRKAFDEKDMELPPPYFGQKVHRAIRQISGNPDPYKEMKSLYNKRALELYPGLKESVLEAKDSFRAAVLISIAGNVIDFGAADDFSLMETIERVTAEQPAVDCIEELKQAVSQAHTILYIGDNAGETVMDRILIEQFEPEKEVTFVVRGGPVLNDATDEDARIAGLHELATIIDNGSDAPGILLEDCVETFRTAFRSADLVIAKGMGNFESLSGTADREVFYLLLVKCDLVGNHIGCPKGKAVILRQDGSC